jgi:branched-subunit amino acid ABC-type transport system permease component
MQTVINFVYLIGISISILILISLGLAVIFGMMKVINLAQGEFMMLGAYVCVVAASGGLPIWLAMLLAALLVGLFGIVVERLVIRHLYGRVIDTLLATWGLSLFLVGAVTLFFGPQSESVAVDLGKFSIGELTYSAYRLVMISVAFVLLGGTYALWRYTRIGLVVRATMQKPDMADAMGVNTGIVYMLTFGFGSALTGLAGAVLVPVTGAAPTMGIYFIAKAFITVISGGPLPMMGTLSASTLFGTTDGIVAYLVSPVVGEIAVLLLAIVLLRMLPSGITGGMRRGV